MGYQELDLNIYRIWVEKVEDEIRLSCNSKYLLLSRDEFFYYLVLLDMEKIAIDKLIDNYIPINANMYYKLFVNCFETLQEYRLKKEKK